MKIIEKFFMLVRIQRSPLNRLPHIELTNKRVGSTPTNPEMDFSLTVGQLSTE